MDVDGNRRNRFERDPHSCLCPPLRPPRPPESLPSLLPLSPRPHSFPQAKSPPPWRPPACWVAAPGAASPRTLPSPPRPPPPPPSRPSARCVAPSHSVPSPLHLLRVMTGCPFLSSSSHPSLFASRVPSGRGGPLRPPPSAALRPLPLALLRPSFHPLSSIHPSIHPPPSPLQPSIDPFRRRPRRPSPRSTTRPAT
jgi:hypothetical protein